MTNHTIQLTTEQFEALQSGQPITIEPPKPVVTKWEPKPGKFTIDLISLVGYEAQSNDKYRLAGAEYQTKSKADAAAKVIRSYARQLAWLAENDDGWIADWSNESQIKYFVIYSHECKEFQSVNCYQSQYVSNIFMSKTNATKLAQLMNDGIVEF